MKVWSKTITVSAVIVADNLKHAEQDIREALRSKVELEMAGITHVHSPADLPDTYKFDDNPDNDNRPISEHITSADIMKESLR